MKREHSPVKKKKGENKQMTSYSDRGCTGKTIFMTSLTDEGRNYFFLSKKRKPTSEPSAVKKGMAISSEGGEEQPHNQLL